MQFMLMFPENDIELHNVTFCELKPRNEKNSTLRVGCEDLFVSRSALEVPLKALSEGRGKIISARFIIY